MRHRLRRWSWAVCVAAASLAVVPTVSRALDHLRGPTDWIQICTFQGVKLVSLAMGELVHSALNAGADVTDHCPLCVLGAAASAPPAVAALMVLPNLPRIAPQARLAQVPRPQTGWRSAQPRAPPA